MAQVKPDIESFARIKVIGVGGGGGNAVSRMMRAKIRGVDFIAINTDAQDLHHAEATEKIHIGKNVTRGLGAGMNPELGRLAAEENKAEIQEALKGADMVFVTCGLGGGTGSGAAPVVADIAREMGAVTIGIVTKPFGFEGKQRSGIAEDSMKNMQDKVDSLIVIPNDKVLGLIDKKTSLMSAFETIDDILKQGVQGISDLITFPGIVNVDFADVKAIMEEAGPALIGIGRATGEDRATKAARMAIHSPLLEIAINGAQGVLFNISGGTDLGMLEVSEAANIITESVGGDAKIIFGAIHDDRLRKGEIKVTVIATGFGREGAKKEPNLFTRTVPQPQMQTPAPSSSAHRVVVEDKNAKKHDIKQIEETDEWEIPAFIRKKK